MRKTAKFLFLACFWLSWGKAQVSITPFVAASTSTASQSRAMNSSSSRFGINIITTANSLGGVIINIFNVTTGGPLAVRLYNVDSNGLPTGTPTELTTINVSSSQLWYLATWTPVSITPGTLYALMFEFATYSGQSFNILYPGFIGPANGMHFTGSSWVRFQAPIWVLDGSGNPLPETVVVPIIRTTFSFSSNNSPNERGIACTFDYPYRTLAVMYAGGGGLTGGATVEVYRAGVNIASAPVVQPWATLGFGTIALVNVQIDPGVEYIFAVKPTSTTQTAFHAYDLNAVTGFPNGYKDFTKLFGHSHCRSVYRTGSGAWTYDVAVEHPITVWAVPAGR